MAQLFGTRADRVLRRALLSLLLLTVAGAAAGFYYDRSAGRWEIGEARPQPIDFRHDLHAGGLAIGCRYCHGGAASGRAAGMPSVATCLTCHAQVWRGTPDLAPLHRAAAAGRPIPWQSVSRLPAHARFHHGAHAGAGVPCATCHGRVEAMAATVKTETMSMGWCLDCHRSPAASGVRRAAATRSPAAHAGGRDLTDCSVCHY